MEKGWKIIYVTADEYLMSIAKDLLQNDKIDSVVINHKDSSYVCWGEAELYVRDEDEQQSIKILEHLIKG
jgi:hypothetical protein